MTNGVVDTLSRNSSIGVGIRILHNGTRGFASIASTKESDLKKAANKGLQTAKAWAELIPMIGEFTLSPETIDGIKYLRLNGKARIDVILTVATGNKICNLSKYWGGELNSRPSDPQSDALTN